MRTLRTPDDRFDGLPDFPWEPRYADVDDQEGATLRMAWVEAGPADGDIVLLLHGEPSWSFLYRSMIPVLLEAGLRVIAPDLVGFGRSDKPTRVADHTLARHVAWTRELVFEVLNLRDITLVGQDWGGIIGLRLVADHPGRFTRVVAANTGLPTGDRRMPEEWYQFRDDVRSSPTLDVGGILQWGTVRRLSDDVLRGYDAPFPDETLKAGPRAMPELVPLDPDNPATNDNRRAWQVLQRLPTPLLVAFSDSDPITGAMAPIMKRRFSGAAGQAHPVIANAGHFLQEDAGPELAAHVVDFVADTPARRLRRSQA